MNKINQFTVKTSQDAKRLETAKKRLLDDVARLEAGTPTDSGLYGKVSEILSQRPNSTITDVRAVNLDDGYIFINNKRYSVEHKTNYTDIEKWINKPIEWQKTHVIHYTIDDLTKTVTNKKTGHTTPSKRLYFDGVLTFYDFFTIGYKFNAIKKNANSRNKTNHTYFRHSLKMCKYLNSLDIVGYANNGYYNSDDFIIEW
jgi:hypothetical protein